jgi:hypothetical protein
MAEDKNNSERVRLARETYIAMLAHGGGHANPTDLATRCFHYADAFMEVELRDACGELSGPEDLNPLDDAFAPNVPNALKHPVNMISKAAMRAGETPETVVNRVAKHWENVKNLRREQFSDMPRDAVVYAELDWRLEQLTQAQSIWPAFLAKAEKLQQKAKDRKGVAKTLAK